MHTFKYLLFLFAAVGLYACSSQPNISVVNHKNQADVLKYIDGLQPRVISRHGAISFAAFLSQLDDKQAIFVGEQHDRYDNHLNQLMILKAVHKRYPKVAIGVEWFQQPYQWVLNRYLNGRFSEKQLLEKSEYYKRWSYRYAMLRPILRYAKQYKIPVIALNAPAELTQKVGKSGLSQLNQAERQQLPRIIHPPEKAYRKKLEKIFAKHSKDKKFLENFISVQRIWDETMAMNAAKFLQSHPDYKLLIFAGNGHIDPQAGIPLDLKRRLPKINNITISSGTKQEKRHHATIDYFVISRAVALPKLGKIGILLKEKNHYITVLDVMDKSAGKKAGLKKGDKIIKINHHLIKTMMDFKLLLSNKKPHDSLQLDILRNGRPLKLTVVLQ